MEWLLLMELILLTLRILTSLRDSNPNFRLMSKEDNNNKDSKDKVDSREEWVLQGSHKLRMGTKEIYQDQECL